MQLAAITATFFTSLINRLGIRPPFDQGFLISNIVQPVSLVDSDITLNAVSSTIVLGTPFTAGVLTAPAVGVILADTGAQNAGNYAVHIEYAINCSAVVASIVDLERRNAANGANIWAQRWSLESTANSNISRDMTITLAAGERLRIENQFVSAGLDIQASIWLQAL